MLKCSQHNVQVWTVAPAAGIVTATYLSSTCLVVAVGVSGLGTFWAIVMAQPESPSRAILSTAILLSLACRQPLLLMSLSLSSPLVRWLSAPSSHHYQLSELQNVLLCQPFYFTDGKTEIHKVACLARSQASQLYISPGDALPSPLALQVASDAGQNPPPASPSMIQVSCQGSSL